MKVFWAVLNERAVLEEAHNSLLDVAAYAQRRGCTRLYHGYTRTDTARNKITLDFLKRTSKPDDVLVMLDNDHVHPEDIVTRLVGHKKDVVTALAFRRTHIHGTKLPEPVIYRLNDGGGLNLWLDYPRKQLVRVAASGAAAICIRRRAFEQIEKTVAPYPFFRYQYRDGVDLFPTEDLDFSERCRQAGVEMWCDTATVTPHLTVSVADEELWDVVYPKIQEQLRRAAEDELLRNPGLKLPEIKMVVKA